MRLAKQVRREFAQITGRLVGNFIRWSKLGKGSVLPGHIGLLLDPTPITDTRALFRDGCIFVTGTNGKSTTTYYLTTVLRSLGFSVCTNNSGANMRAGIASVCLRLQRAVDYGVFEVDEASVLGLAKQMLPSHIVALNFSRDQLDRYTEIESIIEKLQTALAETKATLIYNYGNLYTALLGSNYSPSLGYFVTSRQEMATDDGKLATQLDRPICSVCHSGILSYQQRSTRVIVGCSQCQNFKLEPTFTTYYFDGLLKIGESAIGAGRVELAQVLTATALTCQTLGIAEKRLIPALERTPPIPAHELRLLDMKRKTFTELLLAKNPDSFNRTLADIANRQVKTIVLVINQNLADGIDTSWLWDVQFETLRGKQIYIAGQARYDLQLRLKVAGVVAISIRSTNELQTLIQSEHENLTIIANYTAYSELESLMMKPIEDHADSLKEYSFR